MGRENGPKTCLAVTNQNPRLGSVRTQGSDCLWERLNQVLQEDYLIIVTYMMSYYLKLGMGFSLNMRDIAWSKIIVWYQ